MKDILNQILIEIKNINTRMDNLEQKVNKQIIKLREEENDNFKESQKIIKSYINKRLEENQKAMKLYIDERLEENHKAMKLYIDERLEENQKAIKLYIDERMEENQKTIKLYMDEMIEQHKNIINEKFKENERIIKSYINKCLEKNNLDIADELRNIADYICSKNNITIKEIYDKIDCMKEKLTRHEKEDKEAYKANNARINKTELVQEYLESQVSLLKNKENISV